MPFASKAELKAFMQSVYARLETEVKMVSPSRQTIQPQMKLVRRTKASTALWISPRTRKTVQILIEWQKRECQLLVK